MRAELIASDGWGDWGEAEGLPVVQRPAQSEHAAGAFVRQRRDAAVRSAARDAVASDAAVRSAEERSRAAYDAVVRRVVAAPGDAALAAQLFAAEEDLVQAELAAYAAARGQQREQAQQRARAQRGERAAPPALSSSSAAMPQ